MAATRRRRAGTRASPRPSPGPRSGAMHNAASPAPDGGGPGGGPGGPGRPAGAVVVTPTTAARVNLGGKTGGPGHPAPCSTASTASRPSPPSGGGGAVTTNDPSSARPVAARLVLAPLLRPRRRRRGRGAAGRQPVPACRGPSCSSEQPSSAPSAKTWLAAGHQVGRRGHVAVGPGPGLPGAAEGGAGHGRLHGPRRVLLCGDDATTAAVTRAFERAGVAHVAGFTPTSTPPEPVDGRLLADGRPPCWTSRTC